MGDDSEKGIRILSFDSGGPGTFSQVCLMRKYMSRLSSDLGVDEHALHPADYFDLIGGVGFGGLVAFMLGYLRMTASEATAALINISSTVFPQAIDAESSPEMSTMKLKNSIQDMLQENKISPDTKIYEKSQAQRRCKVALYTATSADISHARILRTYPHRGTSLNPTIIDALCATIAVPSLFSPIRIGPPMREQSFIGGPLGANNPTRELLKEANTVFGEDRRVAQIISIGTGALPALSPDSTEPAAVAGQLMKALMTDCETVASELSTRLLHVDAYVRLNVDRGIYNLGMDDWIRLDEIEDATVSYVQTAAITRIFDDSTKYLQSRIGTATLGQMNKSSSTAVPAKTVPPVSPYYVVRRKEFSSMIFHLIETLSSTQKIFAITGMGGCGKTQMVSYFMQEHGSRAMVYVDASSSSCLKADLQAWSRSLGFGHEQDVWEDALRMLASDLYEGRWALILDNADNPTFDLTPFIPKCYHGTIVITSRNRDVGDLSNTLHLELGEMAAEEALSALLQAARRPLPLLPEEMNAAQELTKTLGYLAVALVQAGTYCHQLSPSTAQQFPFSQYVDIFLSQRAELMNRAASSLDNYQLGAYTAFDLSYNALPQLAKDLLHFTASFNHSYVALAMFATAAGYGFADPGHRQLVRRPVNHENIVAALKRLLFVDEKWSEVQIHQTIHTLRSFSLVTASSVASMVFLHLHPLVHAWARDMLPLSRELSCKMALQVLTSCSPEPEFKLYRHLIPHIHCVLDGLAGEGEYVNDRYAAAMLLNHQGYYGEAGDLLRSVLQSLKQMDSDESESVPYVTGVLASACLAHGKWKEAEKLQLEALERWEEILAADHPTMVEGLGNLAEIFSAQGRHKDAEVLMRSVWEQRQQSLGNDHPHTILAAANLAATYGAQGHYKEAERLELEVLKKWREILGDDHPDTTVAANNLAITHQQLGLYAEAEKLQLEVLERQRRLLGRDNPNTIMTAANLATTYGLEGRHKEAEELELEILKQRTKLHGRDHPNTIMSAGHLASTLFCLRRFNEAEELNLRVLEQRKRLFGKDHPDTTRTLANLASIYSSQGEYKRAEGMLVDVLETQRRTLGEEHPSTLLTMSNLAGSFIQQKEWERAEPLIIEAVNMSLDVLGQEHPLTQRRIRFLRLILVELGKSEDAEELECLLL